MISTIFSVTLGNLNILMWVFIILKLTDLVSWSWWMVLMPLYALAAISVFLVFSYFILLILEKRIN